MTDDDFDIDDVYRLFSSLHRNEINVRTPTGDAIVFEFDAPDPREGLSLGGKSPSWRFEINLHSGNWWLHERTDDGTELKCEHTRSY